MKKLYTEFDLNDKQWEVFKSYLTSSLLEALNEGWIEFSDLYKSLTEGQKIIIDQLGENEQL